MAKKHKKTIIHVNKQVIAANNKRVREKGQGCQKNPPITVKTYNTNDYCDRVAILDENGNEVAEVLYSPDKPLSCGAKVWVVCKYGTKIKD